MPPHLADRPPFSRGGAARREPSGNLADRRFTPARRPRARVHELHIGRRHVLSFVGELDIATVPTLDRAITNAIERGAGQVWVDLRQTTFMDSSGVHCLMGAKQRLSQLNRRFAVVCEAGPVRRILALTGADRAIATYRDRAAAHQAM